MILAGDIGGTKTTLALYDGAQARFERRYASREFPAFDALLRRAWADATRALGGAPRVERACLGVAGPAIHGRVRVTNLPWTLEAGEIAEGFAIGEVRLINDFVASAWGIDGLAAQDLLTLQAGVPIEDGARLLIGAGTGLGMAFVVHDGTRRVIVASEGGHVGFAPRDAAQAALWAWLHSRLGRVEAEHVVSGPGLERIYRHLREARDLPGAPDIEAAFASGHGAAAAIARAALAGDDALAGAALDLFIACYGAVAGDQALALVARGGVYVAGGIAPKIASRLATGGFCAAFRDKGDFEPLARSFPVHVVLDERLGLIGAARAARAPIHPSS